MLALIKVSGLVFVAVCGWVALGGGRVNSVNDIHTPYGKEDLTNIFATRTDNLFHYSLALLNVMRAFLGYENANFVCIPRSI